MKKILLSVAILALLSACGGGGNGSGTVAAQPPVGGVAGSGDAFVSAVYAVTLTSDGNDNVDTYSMYDSIGETMPENTAPDTIPA